MKYFIYIQKWVKQKPLLSFFILAYAISWAFTIPFVYLWKEVCNQALKPWLVVFLPGAYGPTIAALLVTALINKKAGLKKLLSKLKLWRVPWIWYGLAVLFPGLLYSLAVGLSSFQKEALFGFKLEKRLLSIPLYLLAALPFGPLGEELGWRGFALPKLLQNHSPFRASLLLGIVWTFWHTPMFWYPGAALPSFLQLSLLNIGLFLTEITAESVLFTFLYFETKGSVLVAIIFHLSFNSSSGILFSALPKPSLRQRLDIYLIFILLMWISALLSLIFLSRHNPQEAGCQAGNRLT